MTVAEPSSRPPRCDGRKQGANEGTARRGHAEQLRDRKIKNPRAEGRTPGYDVIVPHDTVESLTAEDHEAGLRYPESTYAVKPLPTKELVAS